MGLVLKPYLSPSRVAFGISICFQDQELTAVSKARAVSRGAAIFPYISWTQTKSCVEHMGVYGCPHTSICQHIQTLTKASMISLTCISIM